MAEIERAAGSRQRGGRVRRILLAVVVATAGIVALPPEPAEANTRIPRDACGVKVPKSYRVWPQTYWECTLAEYFDGTSLNTNVWSVQTTAASSFDQGNACYRDDNQNVQVAGGTLRLSARKAAVASPCLRSDGTSFSTPYSGSTIFTGTKFSQTFGRFEIRAKMPNSYDRGLQFAFWLFPVNPTHGPWPISGELDVMEWYSLHPNHGVPNLIYAGNHLDPNHTAWTCDDVVPGEWQTYTVEWTARSIKIMYGSEVCLLNTSWNAYEPVLNPDGTQATDAQGNPMWAPMAMPAPFDHDYMVALTMAPGVDNPYDPTQNNSPVAATDFPATAEIDYVKVWK